MFEEWKIREEDFPVTGSIEEKLKFLLNYAILAPSSHNTQPWEFSIKGSTIVVYADLTRQLHVVDPDNRELYISVGCAIANLLIAAEHFGFGYNLEFGCKLEYLEYSEYSDRENQVAVIEFSDKLEERNFSDLFSGITLRHTNRRRYEPKAVEDQKLKKLKACIDRDFRLDLIKDKKTKSKIARLVASGDRIQLSDKAFRNELASWLRHNWAGSDGMPGFAFGIPGIISLFGSFFIRTFDVSKSQAKKDEKLVNEAAVGILSSAEDNKLFWVKTGIVFEKLMLMAAKLNIRIAFLNQPVEVPELRNELQDLLKMKEFPQLLFRMGYAEQTKHTPRRKLEEVIR